MRRAIAWVLLDWSLGVLGMTIQMVSKDRTDDVMNALVCAKDATSALSILAALQAGADLDRAVRDDAVRH